MGRLKTDKEREAKKMHRRNAQKQKEREDLRLAKDMKQSATKTAAKRPAVVQFRLPNKIG